MSHILTLKDNQAHTQPQFLACRLRRKEIIGRRGPRPFMAEIELENLSKSDLEIEYRMAVLQYLDLNVRDAQGKVVSDHHFGDHFSPFADVQMLRLGPGEKFQANVSLFATMPRGPVAPGTYYVQAVYEYNGFRAESESVEITVASSIA